MIICHCEAVSDRHIRAAVNSGATCPEEIANLCAAGANCGGCRPSIESLLANLLAEPVITIRQRSAA
jgi:bacterioferritin-associated ferredoxin